MKMKIWLDMDGTIADLYGVENWLEQLINENPTPYAEARPLVRMATLARLLNNRQKKGYKICIISALAKDSTKEYDEKVKLAKINWLKKHLPSVKFDIIKFVPYTFIKNNVNNGNDILFDDEERHLQKWTGLAINANNIIDGLKALNQCFFPFVRPGTRWKIPEKIPKRNFKKTIDICNSV